MRQITLRELQAPELTRRYLDEIVAEINRLKTPAAPTQQPSVPSMEDIRAALEADGSTPLNLDGLVGQALTPQLSGALVKTSLPDATQYPAGTLLVVSGSPYTFYVRDTTNPPTWVQFSLTPSNMMTTDSNQTIGVGVVKTWTTQQVFNGGLTTASSIIVQFGNGGQVEYGFVSEALTVSGGVTKDTVGKLPGGSIIKGISYRITTAISGGGVTKVRVGDATTNDRFASDSTSLGAGTTALCMNHQKGNATTEATGPTQAADASIRFTFDAAPAAGAVRVQWHYEKYTAPTS